jgi:hypothetical protein
MQFKAGLKLQVKEMSCLSNSPPLTVPAKQHATTEVA